MDYNLTFNSEDRQARTPAIHFKLRILILFAIFSICAACDKSPVQDATGLPQKETKPEKADAGYDKIYEKIIQGQATLRELHFLFKTDDTELLTYSILALKREYRDKESNIELWWLLGDVWRESMVKYPGFNWQQLKKPAIKISLASVLHVMDNSVPDYVQYIRLQARELQGSERAHALRQLGHSGSNSDITLLTGVVPSADMGVMTAAVKGLGYIGTLESRDALKALLDRENINPELKIKIQKVLNDTKWKSVKPAGKEENKLYSVVPQPEGSRSLNITSARTVYNRKGELFVSAGYPLNSDGFQDQLQEVWESAAKPETQDYPSNWKRVNVGKLERVYGNIDKQFAVVYKEQVFLHIVEKAFIWKSACDGTTLIPVLGLGDHKFSNAPWEWGADAFGITVLPTDVKVQELAKELIPKGFYGTLRYPYGLELWVNGVKRFTYIDKNEDHNVAPKNLLIDHLTGISQTIVEKSPSDTRC